MHIEKLDRLFAAGVLAIAGFHTLATLAFPVRERRPGAGLIAVAIILLLTHAGLYWRGWRVRAWVGVAGYLLLQAVVVFGIGLAGALFPAGVGLYVALTVQAVLLAGRTAGAMAITLGATVLFATNAMLVQDLYRGASAGLLIAVTGLVVQAVGAVLRRRVPPLRPASAQFGENATALTARELEVLRALAAGARNSEIAGGLGIAERTVKAHLSSIFQKLGVASRGAAVATARERGLLGS